ncbi:MAG: hypothetical protein LBM70_08990 [Victivallales bacterium]|jgi:hypoxanthine phosphoribosyltransferase|nr:hypothetical protein [Victivallales bacterium]
MNILYTATQIASRVSAMGNAIAEYYRGKELTAIILMNGGICFGADLLRAINIPLQVDSMSVSSYSRHQSTGVLNFRSTLKLDPAGRHLLIIDEVLDSGITLKRVCEQLSQSNAASLRTCVMIEKAISRPDGIEHADWVGFVSPDRYLVGYGLDSDERYRNLPYIATLD